MNENTVALTRTVAYKKNVDAKTNSLIENGTEQFNSVAYQAKLKKFLRDNLKTF